MFWQILNLRIHKHFLVFCSHKVEFFYWDQKMLLELFIFPQKNTRKQDMFCEKKIRIWEKQVMSTLHDMWWHILCFALTVEHKCITLSSQTIRNQMPLNHNQNLKLLHRLWRRKFKPNLNLNWTFINTYHQIERI